VKLRAAGRAIDKGHHSTAAETYDDAILIEIYADQVHRRNRESVTFVTHNTKDFSHPNGSNKLLHPDMAPGLL